MCSPGLREEAKKKMAADEAKELLEGLPRFKTEHGLSSMAPPTKKAKKKATNPLRTDGPAPDLVGDEGDDVGAGVTKVAPAAKGAPLKVPGLG
jgi:hypothetical protein